MAVKHLLVTIDTSEPYLVGNLTQAAPSKEVREVVRCRECVHFREIAWHDGSRKHRCSGVFTYIEPDPEGFCAWGRRDA